MQVALNRFVTRQIPNSRFSHFSEEYMDWEKLIELIQAHIGLAIPGDREGILKVPLPLSLTWNIADALPAVAERFAWNDTVELTPLFYTPIVQLEHGQPLCGKFESRYGSEKPRKWLGTPVGEKLPAKFCTAVLYSSDLLQETLQNDHTNCWELISLNASLVEDEPMSPDVLMANHFGVDGATDSKLSDPFFIKQLKASYLYHQNKAHFVPQEQQYMVQLRLSGEEADAVVCQNIEEAHSTSVHFLIYALRDLFSDVHAHSEVLTVYFDPSDRNFGIASVDELQAYLEENYGTDWQTNILVYKRLAEMCQHADLAYVNIAKFTPGRHWTYEEL